MIILPVRRSRAKAKYIAHERSECKHGIFGGLIKCQAHNKPPYRNLYFISGVIKRTFRTMKISLFTMYTKGTTTTHLFKELRAKARS